jgi:hypothetical protein
LSASLLVLHAKEQHAKYNLSKQEMYVYVGIGWRFGFDLNAQLTVEGIEYSQGIFLDVLSDEGRDKWAGFGGDLKGFSDFLKQCADSVKRKEEFKGKHGSIELHYSPKNKVIIINKGDFISVTIPAEEADTMHSDIKQIADDFDAINKKLKPAQQAAPRNR